MFLLPFHIIPLPNSRCTVKTDLIGKSIGKTALVQSFGKAFLLPFDFILGRIFTNNKRQKIFNRASDISSQKHFVKYSAAVSDIWSSQIEQMLNLC